MTLSVATALTSLCLTINVAHIEADLFLGKVPVHLESNLALEHALLSELESSLGEQHRTFTEKRLGAIKKAAQPIFEAMPKNENGKLGSAATSYALYRIFVARHAWYVTGLEPFKSMASWNDASPTSILDQRVPEFVSGLFSSRMGETGFGVHELAVLAATLEHFVHKESMVRVDAALRSLDMSSEDVLGEDELAKVMDTYMALYVLGPLVSNMTTVSAGWVKALRGNVTSLYPGFPETQQFWRDVQQSVVAKRDYYYYSDVASLVEEVGDRYGRYQDHECRTLKDTLVEMEDPGTGGAGRVRLADFYDSALNKGKWQFSEHVTYLRELGALDESQPENLRVIIPNYVNGPSNCVASSSYYSVCCMNECDELLGHLETQVAAPEAAADKILDLVSALPSSTLPGNRVLSSWLTHRLQEVANHHDGKVPLHGRLFGQWMHYAYPRECPFPHIHGTTQPQKPEAWVKEAARDFSANKTEMEHYISLPAPHGRRATETGDLQELLELESAMWSMDEELVVVRPAESTQSSTMSVLGPCMRGVVFVGAVASASIALMRSFDSSLQSTFQKDVKYSV